MKSVNRSIEAKEGGSKLGQTRRRFAGGWPQRDHRARPRRPFDGPEMAPSLLQLPGPLPSSPPVRSSTGPT